MAFDFIEFSFAYRKKTVDSLEEGIHLLSPITDESFSIEVRRTHIIIDALKEARKGKFDPAKVLKVIIANQKKHCYDDNNYQVRFVGESAVDSGGPKREFFRLLAEDSKGYFFFGSASKKFFFADVSAVQVRHVVLCILINYISSS